MRTRLATLLFALLAFASCGGDKGTPSGPSPTPTPTTYTLTGTVTDQNGTGLGGATVTVQDGANSGKSASTDGSGRYSLSALSSGGFTVKAAKQYYQPDARGVTLTANVSQDFRLAYIPPFSRSGTGDTVFDMPQSVARVHIHASYTKNSSNFIVYVNGNLTVNELLGTFWHATTFDGTYLTGGGIVEITGSAGVKWTFTEER